VGVLEALIWVFGQTGADDPIQGRWGHGLYLPEGYRLSVEHRGDEARLGLAFKGPVARSHLVEHCTEGKEIASSVRLLAFHLFGGHVLKCAH
jgi:hypothetical protein